MEEECGIPLTGFSEETRRNTKYIVSDVDDTITINGHLYPANLEALWRLKKRGLSIILVTGGSAGWADTYIREWPVDAVIAESGALMLFYNSKSEISYTYNPVIDLINYKSRKEQLMDITRGLKLSTDQYARIFDVAYDKSKLDKEEIASLKNLIKSLGGYSAESSIHLNAWFAPYDKVSALKYFSCNVLRIEEKDLLDNGIYFGDSFNDEGLFEYMPLSVGMYSVQEQRDQFACLPKYICVKKDAFGFSEAVDLLLGNQC